MPPSRFCTTWTWLDGITLPSPRVTSSSSAQLAQAKNATKKAAMANRRR